MRTVDLVIAGDGSAIANAAGEALHRGQRVLVVLRSGDTRAARRLRRRLRNVEHRRPGQLGIVTGAEVVCADGITAVEAVVVRDLRTGRLWAVNAAAFLSF